MKSASLNSVVSIQMTVAFKSITRSTTEIQNQTIQSSNNVNEKDVVDAGDEGG